MPDLDELQQRLAYNFRDEKLLRLALTHPSVSHEIGASMQHNQRLEFLGDAVLGLVLSRQLYETFPHADEGQLTKSRARLANAATLAAHARTLGLGAHLILSRGEENTGGRERASAVADAFEAVLGAIFLDGGFERAREFVLREFGVAFSQLDTLAGIANPKGELQELLQARSPVVPVYQLVNTEGPDHNRQFICAALHEGRELGRGSGKSKRAAESAAALAALKNLDQTKGVES